MSELIRMKQILMNYLYEQEQLNNEYHLGNALYLNGVWDCIKMIDKQINKEVKEMEEYYNETTETESNDTK